MSRYIPGGRVVLCDGTYNCADKINLTRQKTHLTGMGGSTHLRPSSTGFSALVIFREIHCRVSHMLIMDSDDSFYDVRYAIYGNDADGISWPIVESVHTHGAEVRFHDTPGPGIFQLEHHGQPVPDNNGGKYGIYFSNETMLARVHGGYISRPRQHGIFMHGDGGTWSKDHLVEGVLVEDVSQESLGSQDGITLHDGMKDSAVVGCSVTGSGARYGIYDTGSSADNAILGNRLNRSGQSADLQVDGSGSVSAANHADGTIK